MDSIRCLDDHRLGTIRGGQHGHSITGGSRIQQVSQQQSSVGRSSATH